MMKGLSKVAVRDDDRYSAVQCVDDDDGGGGGGSEERRDEG